MLNKPPETAIGGSRRRIVCDIINAYPHIITYTLVRRDIHTKFATPMPRTKVDAMILIVHLKLQGILAGW